jgi:DNA-binding transcriptional ArsR family regulator
MPKPHRRLEDPRELAALAHPVRMAIVELLSISGPLTATELADRLDETPANCSWHLRKLAQHGFVEEAEGGKGRQRPWQVPGLGFEYGDAEGTASAETRRAMEALADVTLGRAVDRLREAHRRMEDEPESWRRALNASETVAWLTVEELAEVNAALQEVMDRYVGRLTDPEQRPDGSRLCEVVAWGVPTYFPGVDPA